MSKLFVKRRVYKSGFSKSLKPGDLHIIWEKWSLCVEGTIRNATTKFTVISLPQRKRYYHLLRPNL